MSKGCLRIQILTLLTPSHKFHRTGQGAHDIAGADGRTDDKTKDGQAAGSRRAARRTDAAATRLVPRSSATTAAAAGGKPDNLQFHPHLANNAPKGKYSLFPYLGEAVSSTSQSVRWVARSSLTIHRRSLVLSQVLLRLEVHSRCYSHSCYSLDVAKRVSRTGDRPKRASLALYGGSRNSNLADQETRPFSQFRSPILPARRRRRRRRRQTAKSAASASAAASNPSPPRSFKERRSCRGRFLRRTRPVSPPLKNLPKRGSPRSAVRPTQVAMLANLARPFRLCGVDMDRDATADCKHGLLPM